MNDLSKYRSNPSERGSQRHYSGGRGHDGDRNNNNEKSGKGNNGASYGDSGNSSSNNGNDSSNNNNRQDDDRLNSNSNDQDTNDQNSNDRDADSNSDKQNDSNSEDNNSKEHSSKTDRDNQQNADSDGGQINQNDDGTNPDQELGQDQDKDKKKDKNPLHKVSPKKKFKDFLRKALNKNKKSNDNKLQRLTSKAARTLQQILNAIKIYTQAMRMFALYKAVMAVKAFLGWITNFVMGVVAFASSILSSVFGFLASLGAIIWAWIAGGIILLATLVMLALSIFTAASQHNQMMQMNLLYQQICETKKSKSDSGNDDSNEDIGGGSGNTSKLKLKPLKFKDYKNHRKEAISLAKAVGKYVGVPASWIFAQIYAEETAFITGQGTVQPVCIEDHNLTGMGPVGVSAGSAHGDGAGGSYGHYKNYHDYAAAYAYTLKHQFAPKKSDRNGSLEHFIHALKDHHYMEDSYEHYIMLVKQGIANYKHGNGGGASSATGSIVDDVEGKVSKAIHDFCAQYEKKNTTGGWVYPFKSQKYSTYKNSLIEGAQFGKTSFDRDGKGHYYHDGVDFGTAKYGGQKIRAIHGGTVTKIGFMGHSQQSLGGYVVVSNKKDGWNTIYQEFLFDESEKKSRIKVREGQHVNPGDTIGILKSGDGVTHVHIGLTKKGLPNPAVSHSYDPSGGWVDCLKYIRDHYGKKKDDSGGDTKLSGKEAAAKAWIAKRESSGNWNATNGDHYGKYQLSGDKFHGKDWHNHHLQSKLADKYVKSKYGSWVNAKKFWEKHGHY